MPQVELVDYHFLLLASNLGAEWLFDGARRYWEHYRPIIIGDLELVSVVPLESSVVVTAIARRDIIGAIGAELGMVAPQAVLDPVVHDLVDDVRLTLNGRVELGQPFGVPLPPTIEPQPTLVPNTTPLYPTPGAVPTAGPSPTPTNPTTGFITQTPTPGGAEGPVFPTPGPLPTQSP